MRCTFLLLVVISFAVASYTQSLNNSTSLSPRSGQVWSSGSSNIISWTTNASTPLNCNIMLVSTTSGDDGVFLIIATNISCGGDTDDELTFIWDITPANISVSALSKATIQCAAALTNMSSNVDKTCCNAVDVFTLQWRTLDDAAILLVSAPFILVSTSSSNWSAQYPTSSVNVTSESTLMTAVCLGLFVGGVLVFLISFSTLCSSVCRSDRPSPASRKMAIETVEFQPIRTRSIYPTVDPGLSHPVITNQVSGKTYSPPPSFPAIKTRSKCWTFITIVVCFLSATIAAVSLAIYITNKETSSSALTYQDISFNVVASQSVIQTNQTTTMTVTCSPAGCMNNASSAYMYTWLFSDGTRMNGSTIARSFVQLFGNNFILLIHSHIPESDLVQSLMDDPALNFTVYDDVFVSVSVVELATNASVVADSAVVDCTTNSLILLSADVTASQVAVGAFIGLTADAVSANTGEPCPQLYHQVMHMTVSESFVFIDTSNVTVMDVYSSAEVHATTPSRSVVTTANASDSVDGVTDDTASTSIFSSVESYWSTQHTISGVASLPYQWSKPVAASYAGFTGTLTPSLFLLCSLTYTIRWRHASVEYVSAHLIGTITPKLTSEITVTQTISTGAVDLFDTGPLPRITTGPLSVVPEISLSMEDMFTFTGASLSIATAAQATFVFKSDLTWDPINLLQSTLQWTEIPIPLSAPTITETPCVIMNELDISLTLTLKFDWLITVTLGATRSYYAELSYPAIAYIGQPVWNGLQSCGGSYIDSSTAMLYSAGHGWNVEIGVAVWKFGKSAKPFGLHVTLDEQICFALPFFLVDMLSVECPYEVPPTSTATNPPDQVSSGPSQQSSVPSLASSTPSTPEQPYIICPINSPGYYCIGTCTAVIGEFVYHAKCEHGNAGMFISEDQTMTMEGCAQLCSGYPSMVGCWYSDGAAGWEIFCRVCDTLPDPSIYADQYPNDYAASMTPDCDSVQTIICPAGFYCPGDSLGPLPCSADVCDTCEAAQCDNEIGAVSCQC